MSAQRCARGIALTEKLYCCICKSQLRIVLFLICFVLRSIRWWSTSMIKCVPRRNFQYLIIPVAIDKSSLSVVLSFFSPVHHILQGVANHSPVLNNSYLANAELFVGTTNVLCMLGARRMGDWEQYSLFI